LLRFIRRQRNERGAGVDRERNRASVDLAIAAKVALQIGGERHRLRRRLGARDARLAERKRSASAVDVERCAIAIDGDERHAFGRFLADCERAHRAAVDLHDCLVGEQPDHGHIRRVSIECQRAGNRYDETQALAHGLCRKGISRMMAGPVAHGKPLAHRSSARQEVK
jgi:hypothetical protein